MFCRTAAVIAVFESAVVAAASAGNVTDEDVNCVMLEGPADSGDYFYKQLHWDGQQM